MIFKFMMILLLLFSLAAKLFCQTENRSATNSAMDSVEFNYPLAIGTTWVYTYYLYYNYTSGVTPPSEVWRGLQSWEVISSSQNLDTATYQMICARTDTVMRGNPDTKKVDTTIQNQSVPFTIVTLPNKIYVNWDGTVRFGIFGKMPIPKYLPLGQSIFHVTDNSFSGASYVSTLGLTNYAYTRTTNTTIFEKLDLVQFNSEPVFVSKNGVVNELPEFYSLRQNYPNPFNPTTLIQYKIPYHTSVNIKIFDVLGREIATLVNEQKEAGIYSIAFDASHFATGIYFYRVQAGAFVETKRMLFMK